MALEINSGCAHAHPRAFAIYKAELDSGKVTEKDVEAVIATFGPKSGSGPVTSFDAFAEAVHKPCTYPDAQGSGDCLGMAALEAGMKLVPMRFERRALRPDDVRLQVMYCGICHSDLHQIQDEWGFTGFPCVPGHEIVGIATEVGSEVTRVKAGDRVAVGCMVDSCGECGACKDGEEQFCESMTQTYNSVGKDGATTRGGYSTFVVCREKFVLRFPDSLPMAAGAPLLCAGITTYSPLRHFGLDKPGKKVGVVGLGGLGHMAVKLAKAFGCEVTVFSTSPGKKEEALGEFGADHFVVSKDEEAMNALAGSLDGVIDTVSANHPVSPYLGTLGIDGVMVVVGAPTEPASVPGLQLLMKRRRIAGSIIGGVRETQEMLDFCAKKGITCKIEEIDVEDVNVAMERLANNDVKYRFVLRIAKSLVD